MRMAILLFVVLILAGCPFGGVTQMNRLPEIQLLPEARLINRPGSLRHQPTGFEFAESYATFQRVTAYQYDTAGLDISVGYNDRAPTCLVVATFYVYPTPRMSFIGASPNVVASLQERWLLTEFARSKAEIEATHPAAHSPAVSPSTAPIRGDRARGASLRFSEGDTLSELRLFIYDRQWFLKYRFTYPTSCESEARGRIDSLLEKLPWAAV